MSASRWLFCVTISPGRGAILNLKTRGPRFGGGEAHAHRRRLAVGRQLHLLRPDDPSVVLDVERHRLAREPGLRHDDVDHQRGALERRARRRHAIDLDVLRERLASDADREYGHRRGLHGEQRVGERGIGRVRAVAHDDQAGKGQAGELLARAIERRAETRLGAGERQIRRSADA